MIFLNEWLPNPNGVDSNYFQPSGEAHDPETIAFVGRMDYYPNQECMFDFCARTLPLVRARRPNVKLLIVGADPSAAVVVHIARRAAGLGSAPPFAPERDSAAGRQGPSWRPRATIPASPPNSRP